MWLKRNYQVLMPMGSPLFDQKSTRDVFWNLLTSILSKLSPSLCNSVRVHVSFLFSFVPCLVMNAYIYISILFIWFVLDLLGEFFLFNMHACSSSSSHQQYTHTHTHTYRHFLYLTGFCGLLFLFSYVSLWSIEYIYLPLSLSSMFYRKILTCITCRRFLDQLKTYRKYFSCCDMLLSTCKDSFNSFFGNAIFDWLAREYVLFSYKYPCMYVCHQLT